MNNIFSIGKAQALRFVFFLVLLAATGILTCAVAQSATANPAAADSNASASLQQRAAALVSRMTLEEKVSQMQNSAAAIPRLGIVQYDWWSEALHGVARSGYATVFPQAIGMAATWDAPLIHREGRLIGMEARGRYNSAIRSGNYARFFGMDFWSPNVNIFRDPRWGRGQETYGEDPFLTGQLGGQFVTGLQGDNPDYYLAISTPKHFAVHSGPESERHHFNVNVSPHDLEDTYLPAFRATIVDAHADSIMCAYNAIDGAPACANAMLLQNILRHQWHFHGYVVSDCSAIRDIAEGHKYAPTVEQAAVDAVRAGTDLSCGNEYASLVQAVHDGLIQEREIDTAVERLMIARMKLGILAPPDKQPYASLDPSIVFSPQHEALNLHAAEESMVLLKNDGVLPLHSGIQTIAVIGPNAASLAALEGNYNGTPIHPVTPLAAFQAMAASRHLHLLTSQGAPYVEQLSLPVPPSVFHRSLAGTMPGLSVQYFPSPNWSGSPVTAASGNIDADWEAASPDPQTIPAKAFSVRWTGTITPPAAGDYRFQVNMTDCLPCKNHDMYTVWVDGQQVSTSETSSPQKHGRTYPEFTVHFSDAKPHTFRMDYSHQSPRFDAGVSLNWWPPVDVLRQQAVSIARKSDVVIAVVGISPRLEGEQMPIHIPGFSGGDRTSIALPDVQQEMLQAVAKTGKPLIVVLMNGSALAVDWSQQHANAILEAWYPGAQGGTAIVNTLLGKNNPAGRLPVTFYRSTDQLPPFDDYSMANRTYRYFKGTPLYGFGYGLSYSQFAFDHLTLSSPRVAAGDPLTVQAEIKNTSNVPGDEVAELYLSYPPSATAPIHSLVGFARIHVPAGAMRTVSFRLDPRQISQVLSDGKRVILPGSYIVFVGGSQPGNGSTGVSGSFLITGQQELAP